MAVRVAINGFGRIGRLVLRAALKQGDFDVVFINDLAPISNLAALLQSDSVHGRFEHTVTYDSNFIYVNDLKIQVFAEADPSNLPYTEIPVDFIIESTGRFTTLELARKHIAGGASAKVLITAPSKDAPMLVMGVNHKDLDLENDQIVSNASCTTNCLAPIAKIINDNFIITEALMCTIHALTPSQNVIDTAECKDQRLCRSALSNIIPSSTGAAKAVGLVIPELAGKISGNAYRVPISAVSLVDLTVSVEKSTTYEEIAALMKEASETYMQGFLGYTDELLVSSDFIGCPLSSIFDYNAGIQLSPNFFKIVAWYDNEWGYANRIVDLMRYMSTA